ncbi:hypothetical protein [Exiguobacterium antarcticum]|uniref:hypothetical protein n=1 Tax=Exiguobacterium antarcticum TaxID=132920 RepID=UPI00047DF712|nr:hypothetical protein [Exiguobacterium antarcticum]
MSVSKSGVALQETGIDNDLTGRELLVLQGKLFGFSQAKATTRATETVWNWSGYQTTAIVEPVSIPAG